MNLYGFVDNDSIGRTDILGLQAPEEEKDSEPNIAEGTRQFERDQGFDPDELDREEEIAKNARRDGRICRDPKAERELERVREGELKFLKGDTTAEAQQLRSALSKLTGPCMCKSAEDAEQLRELEEREYLEAWTRYWQARQAREAAEREAARRDPAAQPPPTSADPPRSIAQGPVPAPRVIRGIPGLQPARPKTPVQGGGGLRRRWNDLDGNIYEWDSRHGAIEKYDRGGDHLGEFDPETGVQLKPANRVYKVEP